MPGFEASGQQVSVADAAASVAGEGPTAAASDVVVKSTVATVAATDVATAVTAVLLVSSM